MTASTNSRASARLEARISDELRDLIKRAAQLQGRTVSDFVTDAMREAAVRAIEAESIVRISRENQANFVRALLSPPAPNAALKRAFAHRRRLLSE
ncbi:MAG: DUF1778 domain-containing protein [Gammaproteobacteria bacterium]|nr:DUF1778 domain-containing protein [Gammaproteobacteria bacterium]